MVLKANSHQLTSMEADLFDSKNQSQSEFGTKRISPSEGILKIDLSEHNYFVHCSAKQFTECWGTRQVFQVCV